MFSNNKIKYAVTVLLLVLAFVQTSGCFSSVDEQITLKPNDYKDYSPTLTSMGYHSDRPVIIRIKAATPDAKINVMVLDDDNFADFSNGSTTYQTLMFSQDYLINSPWAEAFKLSPMSHIVIRNMGDTEEDLQVKIE